jgi:hypothetical protein
MSFFKDAADDLEEDEGEGLLAEESPDAETPEVEIEMQGLNGLSTLQSLSEVQSAAEARAVLKAISRFQAEVIKGGISASGFWRAAKSGKESVLEAGEEWPEAEYKVE